MRPDAAIVGAMASEVLDSKTLRHLRKALVLGLFAVFVSVGCEEAPAEVVVAKATLPTTGKAQPWARQTCQPGALGKDVLACVDGIAITRADYDRVVDEYPAGTAPTAIVQALADAEVLAAAAAKAGLWSDWLLLPHQQAMVNRYVQHRFEDKYTWQDVSQADLHRAWKDWRIRIRYVREPSYFATDAQFLCCSGDWRKCEIDEAAQKCIDEHEDKAKKLHALLLQDPPKTPLEMKGRVYAVGHLFPRVAVTDVNFYYMKDVPHEEQIGKGYEVMVEPYARAVTALSPGQISAPIRTPFGWHITLLNKYEKPLKGKLSDPDVRRDIADNILPLVRKRDVQRHAFELMKQRNVHINFDEALKKG